jgi:predicted DNA-binding antitoxin AbrB/MazE fold protein
MYKVVKATYLDGVLKPLEDLSLEEEQQVVIIILPAASEISQAQSDLDRMTIIKEQTATWLRQQPAQAVRPPTSLDPSQHQQADQDIEDTLKAIRAKASQMSPEEIAADISQALVEAQMIPAEEQARLEAELDAILAE